MQLRAPDLSADTSSAIERAIRAPADKPIEMQGLVTTDLPVAADYPYSVLFDTTLGQPKFSNGTNWLTFSLSTHVHAASAVTFSPTGNIAATNVQAALAEVDTEKGGLSANNMWSGSNSYSDGTRMTGGSLPGSGSGLELRYGGGVGYVTANNRSSGTLLEMRLEADPYRFYVSGSNQALILNNSSGAYFPTAGTTAAPPNAYLDAGSLNNLQRSTYAFGNAAQMNTGQSGNAVPVCNGTQVTWAADQKATQFAATGGPVNIGSTPLVRMYYDGTRGWLEAINSGVAWVDLRITAQTIALQTAGANNRLTISSSGAVAFPVIGTTASAANAFLDSANSNNLLRSTSSIRYKRDVQTLDSSYADAILGLRPVWYRSQCEADNPDWGYWGFIAEEAAEIDPRLVHWAKDADEKLIPDGFQYERLAVLLLDIVKRQQAEIDQIKSILAI